MLVTNIIKDSFTDYKGEHALVVFTHGCNLDCDVCYNKKIKADFEDLGIYSALVQYLTPLHTALVVSGGEPTIHSDLPTFCKTFKEVHPKLKLKIFTNGTNPDIVETCIPYVNSWSIDYKVLSDDKVLGTMDVAEYTHKVGTTVQLLTSLDKDYMIRIWKHPRTSQEDLQKMIENIHYIKKDVKYELVDILSNE
jgi:pyruvate formate lyase activating enzyme